MDDKDNNGFGLYYNDITRDCIILVTLDHFGYHVKNPLMLITKSHTHLKNNLLILIQKS